VEQFVPQTAALMRTATGSRTPAKNKQPQPHHQTQQQEEEEDGGNGIVNVPPMQSYNSYQPEQSNSAEQAGNSQQQQQAENAQQDEYVSRIHLPDFTFVWLTCTMCYLIEHACSIHTTRVHCRSTKVVYEPSISLIPWGAVA